MRHCFEKKSFMSHISRKNGIPCDILAQIKVKNEEMSHDTIQNHNSCDIFYFDDEPDMLSSYRRSISSTVSPVSAAILVIGRPLDFIALANSSIAVARPLSTPTASPSARPFSNPAGSKLVLFLQGPHPFHEKAGCFCINALQMENFAGLGTSPK